MKREPARLMDREDVSQLLAYCTSTRHPERNTVIVQLSFKAGLRACEIAGLSWPMALKVSGEVAEHLSISQHIAKYGSGRRIPMHPDLTEALLRLWISSARPREGPVIRSERGGHMTARSVVNWFGAAYTDLGLLGCSSHSGRRTFITQAARIVSKTGGSLRDVQELAGHRALTTTERYIAGDRDSQRKLIGLL